MENLREMLTFGIAFKFRDKRRILDAIFALLIHSIEKGSV